MVTAPFETSVARIVARDGISPEMAARRLNAQTPEQALTAQADSMLFRRGETLPVHEFHHWDTTANGDAFTARKADGRSWPCGFANEHFYAGFPHLYWAGTSLPRRFVTAARSYLQKEPNP